MAMLAMLVMSNYEDELYDRLVDQFVQPEMSQQETAQSLLHATHGLLQSRQTLFSGGGYHNIRDKYFRSADIQLIDAQGDCGSYSHVLGRLLQRAGFEVRLIQMRCGARWGCHILIEAKVGGRFVGLDPLYNLAFVRPDGMLASANEIGGDWRTFKHQVPQNYPQQFSYEGVRYTNWNKIPFFMPAVKGVLRVFLGDKVETVSIRSWVLNVYKTYLFSLVFGYALLVLLSGYLLTLRKKEAFFK
jgi:hypothetical protein